MIDLNHFIESQNENESSDIICITETWLAEIDTFDMENYFTFRDDRLNGRGGGCLILVRSNILCELIIFPKKYENVEIIALKLTVAKYVFRIVNVYSPPACCENQYNDVFSAISHLFQDSNLPTILCGDFNIPDVNWSTFWAPNVNYQAEILNLLCDFHLTQLIDEPTHTAGNILDLLLVNEPFLAHSIEIVAPLTDTCDHYMITFCVTIPECLDTPTVSNQYFNFSKTNFRELKCFLSNVNWDILRNDLNIFDANEFEKLIVDTIQYGISIFTPSSSSLPKKTFCSRRTVMLKTEKKSIFKQLRKAKKQNLFRKINSLTIEYKNICQDLQRSIRRQNWEREQKILKCDDMKIFYKFVNSKLTVKKNEPPLKINNDVIFSNEHKAESFSDFFASVFSEDNHTMPNFNFEKTNATFLNDLIFDRYNVFKVLKSLKSSLSYGPDKIPNIILKHCAEELASPLSTLFNFSFQEGKLPDRWLQARVIPLYKNKGDPSLLKNFRPISLTSCICKVLERLVKKKLVKFCERSNVFPSEQHGFRSNRSTVTQMLEFCNFLSKNLDEKKVHQIDAVYLDFEKAFDKVCHAKLAYKLEKIGIQGIFLNWLKAFLTNRTQFVDVKGSTSNSVIVSSGVPQGTVLAPVLFLIFTCEIRSHVLDCHMKAFADDIVLFKIIHSVGDVTNLQENLDSVFSYSNDWQLKLSTEKCFLLSYGRRQINSAYSINGSQLMQNSNAKDLGFNMLNSLKPSLHCQSISNSARRRSCLIRRSFQTKDFDFLTKMFCTYVRPSLEYGTSVWSPWMLKDIDVVESVQRSYTKRYPGLWDTPYKDRLEIINLEPLELRRLRFDVYDGYKILNGLYSMNKNDFFTLSLANTRQKFIFSGGRTDARLHFFSNRCASLFNFLPSRLLECDNFKSFKKMLEEYENSENISPLTVFLKGRYFS